VSASNFTPEVRAALIERTAAGISLPDAAALELRETTVKGWLTRGRCKSAGERDQDPQSTSLTSSTGAAAIAPAPSIRPRMRAT
jgi:hypothetical protein